MKRDFLKGLLGESATDDVIDKILNEYHSAVKGEKEKAEKVTADYNALKAEHKSLTDKVGELEKVSGNAEQLQKELEQIKAEQAEKQALEEKQAKNDAYFAELDKHIPKDMQFMNEYARKAIYQEAIEAHEADTTAGLPARFNAIIKDDKGNYKDGMFAKQNQPDNIPPLGDPEIDNKNPFAKETFNLTEQMRMIKENPSQAQMYQEQAGA